MNKFIKLVERVAVLKGISVLKVYENGNHYTAILSNGTRIRETKNPKDTKFTYDFAENCDVKITNHCTAGCPFCHEGSSCDGKHADLNLPIFDTWKPGTEIAIGGGNVLDHPDLIPFLQKMKKQEVICNITVNQKAVAEQFNELNNLIVNGLVNGVGISITNPSNEKDMEAISRLTDSGNIVYHVIAGIMNSTFLDYLKGKKILILGYKDNVGRSVSFKNDHNEDILRNIHWLKDNLKDISKVVSVMSFDNLALAQLDAKNVLGISEREWDLRFQGKDYGDPNGEDAPSTFYFDAVNQIIARSSTQPYDERLKYNGESFEESFKKSLTNYKVNEGEYGELIA